MGKARVHGGSRTHRHQRSSWFRLDVWSPGSAERRSVWSRPQAPVQKVSRPVRAKISFSTSQRVAPAAAMVRVVRRVLAAVFALVLTLASTAEAKKEVPQVLCESCRATLTELRTMVDKTAKKQGRENAVTDAMEAICEDMYNFRTYAYPPPQMQKGCRTIMDRHEEEIETALWRGDENLVEFICGRPKGACHGVDMSEEAMNSKPMEIVKDFDDDEL